jgi:hypothetical protein
VSRSLANVPPYELADPHSVLGAHPAKGGVLIRAYRPDAESVRVLPMGVELEPQNGDGVFEGTIPGAQLPLDYELEVRYPAGDTYPATPTGCATRTRSCRRWASSTSTLPSRGGTRSSTSGSARTRAS